MDKRLKQQLDFVLEIDKEKNILRQTHLSAMAAGKMTQNMPGIWPSCPTFSVSIPMNP